MPRHRKFSLLLIPVLSLCAAASLPKPLPDHPGNIFLSDEHVLFPAPPSLTKGTLKDLEGTVHPITIKNNQIDAGALPVGYYELRREDGSRATTLAVIAPLA